jgi:lactate dehydrogenase-like 2-hydroxyacid dehydrogenase
MAAQVKRVCYFETWQNRVAEEMLRAAGDFDIVRLEYATEASENFQAMSGCHGYYVSSARHETPAAYHVTRDLLARCPNMLVVCTSGAGYDTLDLKACTEAGVLAVHQAGANREAVAEHALAMLLGLAKRLVEADRRLRRERNFTRSDLMGHNIQGKTLGIVGLGFVGTRMAELCRGLFGMRVIAHDPYVSDADFATRGAGRVPLDQLVREADVVSIHCPLTDETHGLMNADRARLDPRREGAGGGAEGRPPRRRRHRRLGHRTAAARPSAAQLRQRHRVAAHRRRDAREPLRHRGDGGRPADRRVPGPPAGRAAAQPGGLGPLRRALRPGVRPAAVGRTGPLVGAPFRSSVLPPI